MQTTLLGLGIAIILALVSALVAPLVIDWNHYRVAVETEASRLTGLNVRVNGRIDARLLPSPVVTLRDVDVGEAGGEPRLRANTLRLELALGPLLRGKVQASEMHLVGPRLSLGLDRSGAIDWPKPSASFRPEAVSISRLNVEDGRITLTDAVSGSRLVLSKLWFSGDVRSFAGPFAGEGAVVVNDALYGYRISGAPADRGGIKIRLGVDPSDRPLTTAFEGTLTFDHDIPQFDGTLALARPVGATLSNGQRVVSEPWRVTGTVLATPYSAALKNLAYRYGPEDRALNFTGNADLALGAHPNLVGNISAMQVDLNRVLASPDVTDRPPLTVLRSFFQTFATTAKLPMPAQIGLSIDALTIGGTSIESLRGTLRFDQTGWSVSDFQFHAPGMTAVTLSGRLTGTPQGFAFNGPASLQSADVDTLLAWLNGRSGDHASANTKVLSAQGEVTIASDRMAVEHLAATLDHEKVEGRLGYNWPLDNRPARLDAELSAAELDLDMFVAFAKAAAGDVSFALPQEATLALDIGKATFAGVDVRAVKAQVKFDAGKLQIDRLSVGDLAGAKLDASGRIDELSSQPRGQLALDLDARALTGLSDIAAKFVPQAADALHHVADRLAPAKVHAELHVEHAATSGSNAELHINGGLAAMRLAIDGKASGEPSHIGAANVAASATLDADDGTAIIGLLGLDRLLAVDQLPGRIGFSATGALNGDIRVDAKVSASGLDSTIGGTVRLTGERSPSGRLQLQAAAGDLRPLHQTMTGQPGAAIAVSGQAALALDGAKLAFTDIAANAGKTSLHGHVALTLADPVVIDGGVEADAVDASSLMAMLLGLPSSAPSAGVLWSSEKISAGAFGEMNGGVTFRADRADLTSTLAMRDLKGVIHFGPAAITLDDIDGSIAGGRITGAMGFHRNPDGLAAHAKVELAGLTAAAIIGPALNVADGQLTLSLRGDGFGASPAALIGSLHGDGTVALKDVQFAGLDAAAFDAAMQAAGQTGTIDLGKVQAAVNAALANGHVVVPEGNAAVGITAGRVNLNHVTLPAKGGSELALDGAIDLGGGTIDARMTLSEPPPASALIGTRPELSVTMKGPFAAPQRIVDMSALTSWLTLRGAELQTRRIESIEANQRQGAVGQAPHPDAPDVRIVAPGAVVESAIPPNLSAAPGPGVRGIERLEQPAAPSPMPEQNRPGNGSAAPAEPIPMAAPIVIRPSEPPARPNRSTANAGARQPSRHRTVAPAAGPSAAGANVPRTD